MTSQKLNEEHEILHRFMAVVVSSAFWASLSKSYRVVADVWEKDIWEFQAKSGSSGSCQLFLHFLGKIAVRKMSGKAPGSPRYPSSRHLWPSDPKHHPPKPHPCHMPQAKNRSRAAIFGMLRCRNRTATFAFLQCGRCFFLHCNKRTTVQKLHCNIQKAALQESGAFLQRFPADLKLPRLGLADFYPVS